MTLLIGECAARNSPSHLHELGHVPYADLAPLGGGGQEVRAAAETVAGDLIGAVGAGELGGAGRQGDGQRDVLSVLPFHKRAVGGMSLVLGPGGGGGRGGEQEGGEFSSGEKQKKLPENTTPSTPRPTPVNPLLLIWLTAINIL